MTIKQREKINVFIENYGKITSVDVTLFYKIRMKTAKGYNVELGFLKSILYSMYQKLRIFISVRISNLIYSSKIYKQEND